MTTRPLAIITTRLPPAACGIGTYSALLRGHWPNEERPVEFLVLDDGSHVENGRDTVSVFHGDAAQLARALSRLGSADVLLHYAGRAYHRFGFPRWLPGALATWRKSFPDARLMIFFHEIPGELPITSRHFWLGRLNAHVIRRLAGVADVVITNTESHRAALRRIARRDDVELVPVGSNVDTTTGSVTERVGSEFILFGLPFGRLQTLQAFDAHIRRWIENQHLTKLHLVGPADDRFAREADELIAAWANPSVVLRHGLLPSADVSRLLHQAVFALTNVTRDTWSKSTAFMAAAGNGCALVVRDATGASPPFSHVVTADEVEQISPPELEQRTDALARWYHENADWPVIAARVAALWPDNRRTK